MRRRFSAKQKAQIVLEILKEERTIAQIASEYNKIYPFSPLGFLAAASDFIRCRLIYLLRNLVIERPNQVWGLDITFIRLRGGWLYLVAVLDWFSRFVVSWELSQSLEIDIVELRRNIFSRLSRARLAPFSLGKLFRLNNDTLRTSTTLNRLSMELSQNKSIIQRNLREISDLSLLREPRHPREKKLSEILFAGIKFRLSAISKHLEFAEQSFSRYVDLINTAAIYWLSLIVAVVTIVGLVRFDEIRDWFSLLLETVLRQFNSAN